ncbi:M20 family metallo-hydrolase [Myroides sp. JBRI-B21084]|uniref:M20 family metallo-hydrolase n=1 Tax=Myroides sp. JBRI-B21084 TaxID=3119977 RepID=UPI0026E14AB8|nr:M20 family metallo-hydrolase [Paenimyroides cloacae]WKW46042.1 M20 family metallo-hydrolase [Paenimyroides cloacae]
MKNLKEKSIGLLIDLIKTQSFSKEEQQTATIINTYIQSFGVKTHRELNNVWAFNKYYNPLKPTILLNSHHDTVRPNIDYTRDPFLPEIIDGKLYGLGSNDAGGCLVALIATFLHYYDNPNLKYNFVLAATAEEEILGLNGLESVVPKLGTLDFAIVGEPTQMHLAVAEKGLMVLECKALGKSGHAARNEGENAIYNAIEDILWFKTFEFPKQSEMFGPIKMSVTMINAGTQHNVVPSTCDFVVDVRITDAYTNEEVLEIIKAHTKCEIKPRSTRLRPSFIALEHPIVKAGLHLGRTPYGSPTTSDQAVLKIPSIKLGPGNSARSHTADEYVFVHEIEEGIDLYIEILNQLVL